MKFAYPYIENPSVELDIESLKSFTWSTILGATITARHGRHQIVTPRRRYDNNNNNNDTAPPEKYPSGGYTSSSTQVLH